MPTDERFGMRVRVARVAWRMTANAKTRYSISKPPADEVADGVRWYSMEPDGVEYTFRVPRAQALFAAYPGEIVAQAWPGWPLDGSDRWGGAHPPVGAPVVGRGCVFGRRRHPG